jgi:hypothetical protein
MEKAILDYFYINPALRTVDDFSSLRINREEMISRFDAERFNGYLQRFDHRRLSKTAKRFLGWLEYA